MTVSDRNVAAQRRDWDDLAALDARWAVVSQPHGKHNGWCTEPFYATGEVEVEATLARLRALGLDPARSRALDFGCGLGRITASLGRRFTRVDGVDISPAMVAQARVSVPDSPVTFHVGDGHSLSMFGDGAFDFLYSNIVLQHFPSRQAVLGCVAEFMRVLAPDGIAVFQIPTRVSLRYRLRPRARLYHALRACGVPREVLYYRLALQPMCMTAARPEPVRRAIETGGGTLLAMDSPPSGVKGVDNGLYFVRA
jgi:SAM-dependent methyltransferase